MFYVLLFYHLSASLSNMDGVISERVSDPGEISRDQRGSAAAAAVSSGPASPKSRISAEDELMTADNLVEEQQKQRGRPFVKGQSGNPAGRPRRTRSGSANAVQLALESEAEALGRKAVELALNGDAAALRLCLDRLMPLRRDRAVALALPSVRGAGDITAAMATIIAAVTRGKISPREGVDLAKLVDILMRAIETRDFDSRLRVLEEDACLGP
jgi:hypothetical protein